MPSETDLNLSIEAIKKALNSENDDSAKAIYYDLLRRYPDNEEIKQLEIFFAENPSRTSDTNIKIVTSTAEAPAENPDAGADALDIALHESNSQAPVFPKQLEKITEKVLNIMGKHNCHEWTKIDLSSTGITCIPENSFRGFKNLREIVFPANLSKIGNYAFADCKSLKTITLPETVTEIGSGAFANSGLADANLDESKITYIPDETFKNCKNLKHINLPSNLNKICNNVFENCENLNGINVHHSITEIGDSAFLNSGLTDIDFGATKITDISNKMFKNCKKLQSIKLNSNLKTIGENAFEGCVLLKRISVFVFIQLNENRDRQKRIPDFPNITNLGKEAFLNSGLVGFDLSSVVLNLNNNHRRSIPEGLFKNCKNLTYVKLPCTLDEIESSAFEGCENLSEIKFPESIVSIGKNSFLNSGLRHINLAAATRMVNISEAAFKNCQKLQSVKFPDSLESIGDYAFGGCRILYTADIPTNIRSIGKDVFSDTCIGCTEEEKSARQSKAIVKAISKGDLDTAKELCDMLLNSGADDKKIKRFENLIINSMQKKYSHLGLKIVMREDYKGNLKLGDNVDYVLVGTDALRILDKSEEEAFSNIHPGNFNMNFAIDFSIENQLVYIPEAFLTSHDNLICADISGCNAMKSLYKTFSSCGNLQHVALPKNFKVIPRYTFNDCYSLTKLSIPQSVELIDRYAFIALSLRILDLSDSTLGTFGRIMASLEYSSQVSDVNISEIIFPRALEKINSDMLTYKKLTKADFGDTGIKIIPAGLFSGFENLEKIILPHNLSHIEKGAFENSGLKEIDMDDTGVRVLSERAFNGCKNLCRVILPECMVKIGSSAFAECKNLNQINIPCNVSKISCSAFVQSGLADIDLSRTDISSISDYTFGCCNNLQRVALPKQLCKIGIGSFSGCSNLKTIDIPNKVFSIGNSAFAGSGLVKLDLSKNTGIRIIRQSTFEECTNLNDVALPKSIQKIDEFAFLQCTGLKKISAPPDVLVNSSSFRGAGTAIVNKNGPVHSLLESEAINFNKLNSIFSDGFSLMSPVGASNSASSSLSSEINSARSCSRDSMKDNSTVIDDNLDKSAINFTKLRSKK